LPEYLAKDITDSIKLLGIERMKKLIKEFLSKYKFK
jgi:hypothetical protein